MPRKTKNTVASETAAPASGSTSDQSAPLPVPTEATLNIPAAVVSEVPPPNDTSAPEAPPSTPAPLDAPAPKKRAQQKPKAEKKKPKASTSNNSPDDDDESASEAETEDAGANSKQRKVNTSELLSMVIETLNNKCSDMTNTEDPSEKERKFKKAWTGLSNDQKSILTSMILYSTFDVTKAKICEGYAVAFNGLITLKATCQLARKWLSPPTSSGKPTEVGDRLRARFSICEDLKRKLAEAPVPDQLKERAVQKKQDAATKAAAKATKQQEA